MSGTRQNNNNHPGRQNADRIQGVLTDQLFLQPEHISDVKQVLELMHKVGQSISEEQIRAVILLEMLGNNKRLHPENPYKFLIDRLIGTADNPGIWKMAVVPVGVYLDTIQELVPKPPKPIIMAPGGAVKGGK